MIFADIPPGVDVFLDANVLVYHFTNHPAYAAACTGLLDNIEHQLNRGAISASILSEAVHRLMTMEAATTFGWPIQGTTKRLRRHPDVIQQLSQFRQAIDEINAFGVQVMPITVDMVAKAADVSRKYGLLSNDALVVAVMQDHGLTHLASHDADFDRVPGIARYAST